MHVSIVVYDIMLPEQMFKMMYLTLTLDNDSDSIVLLINYFKSRYKI